MLKFRAMGSIVCQNLAENGMWRDGAGLLPLMMLEEMKKTSLYFAGFNLDSVSAQDFVSKYGGVRQLLDAG